MLSSLFADQASCVTQATKYTMEKVNLRLCYKSFNNQNVIKDPAWPSGLVAARCAGAPGSLPGGVGLSEINFSDLYCGWLGRIINVEYTQHNTIYWGAVV